MRSCRSLACGSGSSTGVVTVGWQAVQRRTIGRVSAIDYATIVTDEHNMPAALVRRPYGCGYSVAGRLH